MNVLYFAALREKLKCSQEHMVAGTNMTVAQLRLLLMEKYGKEHFSDNIICAVNHTVANDLLKLNNDDEVAFYPPVTGG